MAGHVVREKQRQLSHIRSLLKQVKELRSHIVAKFQEGASKFPISCRGIGCVGCCRNLAAVGLFEGAIIADTLVESGRHDILQAASEQGQRQMDLLDGDVSALVFDNDRLSSQWLDRNDWCALLDRSTGACTVYDVRPLACATHVMLSDPMACYSRSRTVVRKIDNMQVMCLMMGLDGEFLHQLPGTFRSLTPMPLPLGVAVQRGAQLLFGTKLTLVKE
jgi:Fe-S-cluster containining protein